MLVFCSFPLCLAFTKYICTDCFAFLGRSSRGAPTRAKRRKRTRAWPPLMLARYTPPRICTIAHLSHLTLFFLSSFSFSLSSSKLFNILLFLFAYFPFNALPLLLTAVFPLVATGGTGAARQSQARTERSERSDSEAAEGNRACRQREPEERRAEGEGAEGERKRTEREREARAREGTRTRQTHMHTTRTLTLSNGANYMITVQTCILTRTHAR